MLYELGKKTNGQTTGVQPRSVALCSRGEAVCSQHEADNPVLSVADDPALSVADEPGAPPPPRQKENAEAIHNANNKRADNGQMNRNGYPAGASEQERERNLEEESTKTVGL